MTGNECSGEGLGRTIRICRWACIDEWAATCEGVPGIGDFPERLEGAECECFENTCAWIIEPE
jgi:hypothetical protein